jgi:SAM-dependent methyltransferase
MDDHVVVRSKGDPMTQDTYRRMVLDEWTDAGTVGAWRRWHPKIVVQQQLMKAALLEHAGIRPGMRVLDLASGTGDPAIAIAGEIGDGHVTASDLSADFLRVCEDNAREAGRTNMTFKQADAESLPFADDSFDRVTSRLGVMYFVDAQRALKEIKRVLKPGGTAAFVAWGPAEASPYFLCGIGPFMQRLSPPPPPADAPTPLRFAASGSLSRELGDAGYHRVREEQRSVNLPWPGSPEELWQHLYDVAVPMRPLFDGLVPAERAQAVSEAVAAYNAYYDGSSVNVPAAIVVASGEK